MLDGATKSSDQSESQLELHRQEFPASSAASKQLIINGTDKFSAVGLAELWEFRELLYFLLWRDIKARYKQSILGLLWVVINPLFSTLIYSFFLTKVIRISTEGVSYPLFAFSSILLWNLFSASATRSTNSIVNNGHLIAKVYFPRLLIPLSAVAIALVDFVLASLTMVLIFAFLGEMPKLLHLPLLCLIAGFVTILGLGIGLVLSPINVKIRDVSHVLPFFMQLFMFASPVLYSLSQVPDQWQWLKWINPMVGYLESFRSLVFDLPIQYPLLGGSILMTSLWILVGTIIFHRFESTFADTI